jgi:hypothetical protein
MSEIKVDQLSPRTASGTITLGSSGDSLTIPSGVTLTNNGTASGFGLFTSYAIILDQKTAGTDGGTFTSGAWRTRDLNTIHADPDSIVTLSANQFTLGAGTYWIEAFAEAAYVRNHQLAIYDVTGTTLYSGINNFSQATGDMWTSSMVSMRHTAASSNTYELQHRCRTTKTTTGFGISHGSHWTDTPDIYAVVKIIKEA